MSKPIKQLDKRRQIRKKSGYLQLSESEEAKVKEIIDQLKKLINDKSDVNLEFKDLTAKERGELHGFCRNNKLFSKTNDEKTICTVSSKPFPKEEIKDFEVTRKTIQLFCELNKIKLPSYQPKYVEYFMKIVDLNEGSNHYTDYLAYLEEVKSMGGFKAFDHNFAGCVKRIDDYFRNSKSKELDIMRSKDAKKSEIDFGDEKYRDLSKNLYAEENKDKFFVSCDLKEACYQIVYRECPELVDNCPKWTEFVSKFTDSNTLRKSKHLRSCVFGDTKLGKHTAKYYKYYASLIINYVGNNEHLKVKYICQDDVTFEVKDRKKFDFDKFSKDIEDKYPNMFNIKIFKLVKLGAKDFYLKEYLNSKKELKCVGENFVLQSWRFYNQEPCEPEDLIFTYGGQTATFLEPIDFSTNEGVY
jgi:hypothetical protein